MTGVDSIKNARAVGDSKYNQFKEFFSTEVQKNEEIAPSRFFKRRHSMLDVDGKDPVERNKLMMQESKWSSARATSWCRRNGTE